MIAEVVPGLSTDQLLDEKYRIVRFIGQGAWASVYEGVNVRLHRRVAIKVLGTDLSEQPEMLERFTREAQMATSIDSPNVVRVFDLGSLEDGRPYIVMELLEGEDLSRRLEKLGSLPPEVAVYYAAQALRGLADAHSAGVVHRDIKPSNVVIVKSKHGDEIVKIVDFGVSKIGDVGSVDGIKPSSMTQTNALLGSPVYMSPEQCRGARDIGSRSDLYSIGVVLFETITGQPPHVADSFNELMFKIALEDAPDARTLKPDLDPELAAILARALSRDPANRYDGALDFQEDLLGWAERRGFEPRSWPTDSGRGKNRGDSLHSSQSRKRDGFSGSPSANIKLNSSTSPPFAPVNASTTPPYGLGNSNTPPGAIAAIPPPPAESTDAFARTGEVATQKSRNVALLVAGMGMFAVAGAILLVQRAQVPSTNAQPNPQPTQVAAPPPVTAAATTARVETPEPPTTAAATATPTAEATAVATTHPRDHRQPQNTAGFRTGGKTSPPPPSAIASSTKPAPPASTPTATAAPTGTSKSTVEGRTIRTTLE